MEIEVEEYIRTNEGEIHKIIETKKDDEYSYKYYICDNDMGYLRSQIVNHSKNIINLLEVGDICFLDDDFVYIYDEEFIDAVKRDIKRGNKLISILTHEQYAANCYKLEKEGK